VTKLSTLEELPDNASASEVGAAVDASVLRSCEELKQTPLQVLLLHRWKHRFSHGNRVWTHLLRLQSEGLIGTLGASVSTPAEAMEALVQPEIGWLQLPYNVLDRRWESQVAQTSMTRTDVVIHARSVLLQGILAAPAEYWPPISSISPPDIIAKLDRLVADLNRTSRTDLCLAFVRAQPWIHSMVVGVETQSQLRQLGEMAQSPPLSPRETAMIKSVFPDTPEALLNPALWPSR
jgi:spore coat polysaccharide biosynthesis protein SpsF